MKTPRNVSNRDNAQPRTAVRAGQARYLEAVEQSLIGLAFVVVMRIFGVLARYRFLVDVRRSCRVV